MTTHKNANSVNSRLPEFDVINAKYANDTDCIAVANVAKFCAVIDFVDSLEVHMSTHRLNCDDKGRMPHINEITTHCLSDYVETTAKLQGMQNVLAVAVQFCARRLDDVRSSAATTPDCLEDDVQTFWEMIVEHIDHQFQLALHQSKRGPHGSTNHLHSAIENAELSGRFAGIKLLVNSLLDKKALFLDEYDCDDDIAKMRVVQHFVR